MFNMTKKQKTELLDIFGRPNLKIEQHNYKKYNIEYYKVSNLWSEPLVDFAIIHISRNLARYEIKYQANNKISCLIRPNAVFHTAKATDILEVYTWLQLRFCIQKSTQK